MAKSDYHRGVWAWSCGWANTPAAATCAAAPRGGGEPAPDVTVTAAGAAKSEADSSPPKIVVDFLQEDSSDGLAEEGDCAAALPTLNPPMPATVQLDASHSAAAASHSAPATGNRKKDMTAYDSPPATQIAPPPQPNSKIPSIAGKPGAELSPGSPCPQGPPNLGSNNSSNHSGASSSVPLLTGGNSVPLAQVARTQIGPKPPSNLQEGAQAHTADDTRRAAQDAWDRRPKNSKVAWVHSRGEDTSILLTVHPEKSKHSGDMKLVFYNNDVKVDEYNRPTKARGSAAGTGKNKVAVAKAKSEGSYDGVEAWNRWQDRGWRTWTSNCRWQE